MPRWDNNELDDQPTFDASVDFRGGLNSTVLPHLLQQNQYANGVNVMLNKAGRLLTRGGTTVLTDHTSAVPVRGSCFYEATIASPLSTVKEVVTVIDNELRVWDDSASTVISGYDLTGQVSVFQGMQRVYFCSNAKLLEYDGTHATPQVYQVNRLTVAVNAPGTGYVVGEALTFTGTPAATAVGEVLTVGGGGEILTITILDRGRGYASAPTVGVTTAGGSGATFTVALVDPPTGTLGVWHTERIFLAGDEDYPERLHISDLLDGGYWGAANSLDVGNDGQPITGLHSWDNYNLLVFKATSTYLVNTDPTINLADWTIQKVSSTVGCVAHETAVQVGADVWWMSRDGIQSVRRMAQETQREIQNTISTPIQSHFDNIAWAGVAQSNAVYFDNKYILSIPSGVASLPDTLLVYDTYHQVWVSEWSGVSSMSMTVSRFGNEAELNIGTEVGELRVYDPDTEVETDGVVLTDIATTVELRAFSFSDPFSQKSLLNIGLEFQSSTATITLAMAVSERPYETVVSPLQTYVTLLTLPFTLPAVLSDGGHYRRAFGLLKHRRVAQAQPRISSTGGRLGLRSVTMTAFVEPMQIEV
jgi:hypothetical protein